MIELHKEDSPALQRVKLDYSNLRSFLTSDRVLSDAHFEQASAMLRGVWARWSALERAQDEQSREIV